MRFPLEVAEKIATALEEKLAPHAERIEIAGSIRRRRPDVGDIDLVAIPKLEQVTTGLFTTETQRPRDSRLAVEFCALTGKLMARGDSIIRGELVADSPEIPEASELLSVSRKSVAIGIDLYLATAETWATTLLIRTGSAAHNIWLCQRAREMGGKLHANGEGLELPGQYDVREQRTVNMRRIVPQSEAEIFAALKLWRDVPGLPQPGVEGVVSVDAIFIGPGLREVVNGRPAWLPQGGK